MAKQISFIARKMLEMAHEVAESKRNEFVTPEHLLCALLFQETFVGCLEDNGCNTASMRERIDSYINDLERIPEGRELQVQGSRQMMEVMRTASEVVDGSRSDEISVPHLVYGITRLKSSYARDIVSCSLSTSVGALMSSVYRRYGEPSPDSACTDRLEHRASGGKFIGREREIDEAVAVICRKDRNNILVLGEHGVGKSAFIDAVTLKLHEPSTPERVRRMRVCHLRMAQLAEGSEYRGALEQKVSQIMGDFSKEGDGRFIVVIEDVHELCGFGGSGNVTYDTLSMFLPYLRDSSIPFICTSTFEELGKVRTRSGLIDREFHSLELREPDMEEAVGMVSAAITKYGEFHQVLYSDRAIDYAVRESSSRSGLALPKRAIDLLDECGAVRERDRARLDVKDPGLPLDGNLFLVDEDLVKEVLHRDDDGHAAGEADPVLGIDERLRRKIFGQNEAISRVCSALYLSRSGLGNPQKPLGSFLFVGPTGVGKTQLAKELAAGLGIPLVRFDMSEYSEKHTVAKFIGSPAGYVGYEDGGLLTEAMRKNPRCVLLLDEIEKAHADIYNLLLQVMDYGTMTDSRGQKADFRNSVIIMTSNAGARYSSQAPIGFGRNADPGRVMGAEVLKTFAPEFVNRLSATVVFNAMDKEMAGLVMKAKLASLDELLAARGITVTYTEAALDELLRLGFSAEYGAREMERAVDSMVKPLLVKEILFGDLKAGGKARILHEGEFKLEIL